MTQWAFKKTENDAILISMTEEKQPEVVIGQVAGLHYALMEVASYFKPGDIVTTFEGSCIIEKVGALNN